MATTLKAFLFGGNKTTTQHKTNDDYLIDPLKAREARLRAIFAALPNNSPATQDVKNLTNRVSPATIETVEELQFELEL